VKSPPELWSELSDPSSLARHLGELGEIRITRVEAETTVEWEAESVMGTIALEPAGWGTKVTLTVAREIPEPTMAIAQPEPESAPEPEPAQAPEAALEPEAAHPPTPRWRGRLLARISRWRRALRPAPDLDVDAAVPDAQAVDTPDPAPDPSPEPAPDLAAELAAELTRLEATMAEQDAALLAGVLDRLGAAHHRPFSRG
jgi:hypothetical protein